MRERHMRRMVRRIVSRLRSQLGFSVVEILVGGLVLVVGLIMMSQFFASAASRVLESDIRSVLHQVATEDIESIRGIDYSDVGTTTGHPQGVLLSNEERVVGNLTVKIHREVIFWTDEAYDGPYPANYRRVTVTVSAVGHEQLKPVEMTTNVAGHVAGGTIDVTVTNLAGQRIPDALIVVDNTYLIPSVHLEDAALRTDINGKLIIPGLVPDEVEGYIVSASKTGYNTDVDGPKVVVDGLPYTPYNLIIDRLSTLGVRVVDTEGNDVPGLDLTIVGPDGFDESFVSAEGGVVFYNIRYGIEDSDGPYKVRLLGGEGYDPQEETVILAPGETRTITFVVPADVTTTTVGDPETPPEETTTTTVEGETPPSTETTTTSTTSTTVSTPSTTIANRLTVTVEGWVWRYGGGWQWRPIQGASVSLGGGRQGTTNSSGFVTFTDLENQTYSVTVTAGGYRRYDGSVLVTGATSLTVQLESSWSW